MSLSNIRARVEAATEGRFSFIVEGMWRLHSGDCPYAGEDWDSDSKPDADCTACRCIALMHHDIPLLLKVAEAARESIMWRGEVCPEWPEMKHGDCISRCGNRRVCAALAELEAGE